MRNQLAIAALFALSATAGGAFAGTPVSYGQGAGAESTPFVSTASRADVQANAAKSLGQIRYGQAGGTEQAAFVSTRSRADVVAETRLAQRSGELQYGQGAGNGSAQVQTSTNIASDVNAPSAM